MDPLTALGLASNIVQFVDFTSKLISATHNLYSSTSGAKDEHLELEALATNIRGLADQVAPPPILNTRSLSGDYLSLIELGDQCRGISDELLSVLRSLKVQGSHKVWKSFYQAIRSELKKEQIASLQARLDRIGERLSTQFLIGLSHQVFSKLQILEVQNYRLEAARGKDIRALSAEIDGGFKGLQKLLDDATKEDRSRVDLLKQLSLSAEKGNLFSAEQRILEFLHFDGMEDRHANIRRAHDKTFPWIFHSSGSMEKGRCDSQFVEWMVSDENLYWISGKPGSGKSTVMKYVCSHDLTRVNLEKWSAGCRMIVAKFFFWTASRTPLPKSQQGLLRSMLYQILGQRPDLIPQAFPRLWHAYTMRNTEHDRLERNNLTLPELLSAFENVSSRLVANNTKLCFFIDGLDEYDGKPNDIIPLIESFIASPNIKACISSRPWNEFEKVFGQVRSRKLYIEEFNKQDIERYVRDTLEKDPTYQELQDTDDNTPDLVRDVVEAASGVFLWVYLVVQSLLDGLTDGNRITDLQRRLRLLPKDLKEYFKSIFNSIDEFYVEQTAHIFLVTLAAHTALPLLTYWFIDEEDQDYALKMAVQPLSMQKTNFRLKQMRKRLNACCKGLLEVQFYDQDGNDDASLSSSVLFQWKVDFLHRTVRDFLVEDRMRDLLTGWAKKDFDVDVTICEALLAQIKTSPQDEEYLYPHGPIGGLVSTLQYHAQTSSRNEFRKDRKLLLSDALKKTLEHQNAAVGRPIDPIGLKVCP